VRGPPQVTGAQRQLGKVLPPYVLFRNRVDPTDRRLVNPAERRDVGMGNHGLPGCLTGAEILAE